MKAADLFKDDPKIELAAVDCTKHREVCSANGVQGYPTIKYFSYLKTSLEYNGGRVADDFIKYLRRKSEGGPEAEDDEPEQKKEEEEAFREFKGGEFVIQANDKTFYEAIRAHKTALVFFYASWCGHCKVVKPVLAELAQQLHEEGDEAVKVVAIDASENGKVGQEFGIKGFPTIKLFVDGKATEDFKMARTKEAFYSFIKTNGRPKEEL